MAELVCWNCGASLQEVPRPISRHAACPDCFHELRCCRLCRHYDPQIAAGQCDEERADPPVNKENANFCDWFQPRAGAFQADRADRHLEARGKLDALFGGAGDASAEEPDPAPEDAAENAARAKLDALFSKRSGNDDK